MDSQSAHRTPVPEPTPPRLTRGRSPVR
jgi:hypothetical protein